MSLLDPSSFKQENDGFYTSHGYMNTPSSIGSKPMLDIQDIQKKSGSTGFSVKPEDLIYVSDWQAKGANPNLGKRNPSKLIDWDLFGIDKSLFGLEGDEAPADLDTTKKDNIARAEGDILREGGDGSSDMGGPTGSTGTSSHGQNMADEDAPSIGSTVADIASSNFGKAATSPQAIGSAAMGLASGSPLGAAVGYGVNTIGHSLLGTAKDTFNLAVDLSKAVPSPVADHYGSGINSGLGVSGQMGMGSDAASLAAAEAAANAGGNVGGHDAGEGGGHGGGSSGDADGGGGGGSAGSGGSGPGGSASDGGESGGEDGGNSDGNAW